MEEENKSHFSNTQFELCNHKNQIKIAKSKASCITNDENAAFMWTISSKQEEYYKQQFIKIQPDINSHISGSIQERVKWDEVRSKGCVDCKKRDMSVQTLSSSTSSSSDSSSVSPYSFSHDESDGSSVSDQVQPSQPVNFDFEKINLSKNRNIARPVAIRRSPDGHQPLVSSDEDVRKDLSPSNTDFNFHSYSLFKNTDSSDLLPKSTHSKEGEDGWAKSLILNMPIKKNAEVPPPPIPSYRPNQHIRSSSLDLKRVFPVSHNSQFTPSSSIMNTINQHNPPQTSLAWRPASIIASTTSTGFQNSVFVQTSTKSSKNVEFTLPPTQQSIENVSLSLHPSNNNNKNTSLHHRTQSLDRKLIQNTIDLSAYRNANSVSTTQQQTPSIFQYTCDDDLDDRRELNHRQALANADKINKITKRQQNHNILLIRLNTQLNYNLWELQSKKVTLQDRLNSLISDL